MTLPASTRVQESSIIGCGPSKEAGFVRRGWLRDRSRSRLRVEESAMLSPALINGVSVKTDYGPSFSPEDIANLAAALDAALSKLRLLC